MRQNKDPFSIRITGGGISDRDLTGYSDRMFEGTGIVQESIGSIGRLIKPRTVKIYALVGLFFGLIIFSRIVYLQVISGNYYRDVAEGNRIKMEVLPAPRGIIVDSRGQQLVENTPQFNLIVNPANLPKDLSAQTEQWQLIAGVLNISEQEIKSKVETAKTPITVVRNLTRDQSLALMTLTDRLKGIEVEMISARKYVADADLGHVLGYMTLITPEEYSENRGKYLMNDLIGRSGIESYYEDLLKGANGSRQIEVDNLGKLGHVSAFNLPVSGARLTLSIDLDLQKKLVSAMGKHLQSIGMRKAAGVVMNPNTGEILAMASFPTFNPNLFNSQPDAEEVRKVLEDKDFPFFNRAISGEYASGSTVKPVFAAAALQEKIINNSTTFLSTGGVYAGQSFFGDWKAGGHGVTNIYKAIAESVNTFFYLIGGGGDNFTGLGVEKMDRYLSLFNFGKKTGVDIGQEANGFIPTPEWKQQTFNDRWYLGDTYNLAIGQGNFLTTPIQLATAYSAIANGGKLVRPRLLKMTTKDDKVENTPTDVIGKLPIDDSNLKIVRDAMRQTVLVGSGRSLAYIPLEIAGKTGTAETNSNDKPNAWFGGFFPASNPQVVIVMLVEKGGESTYAAVPIVRDVLDWYSTNR